LLRAPEYGHALQSLESYTKNAPDEIGPKYHSYLYLSLRKVYSSLGNTAEAIECAKKAFDISSRNRNSYIDQSDAALELGLAEWDARVDHSTGSTEELQQIEKATDLLRTWVEKDASESYLDGERIKCHQLGVIENYLFNFHHFEDAANKAKQWFRRGRRGNQENSNPSYEDIDAQVHELTAVSNFEEAIRVAKSGLEQWQSALDPPRFHLAQGFFRVATTLHLSARHRVTSGSFESSEDIEKYAQTLMESMQYSYEALKAYRSTGGAEMTVTCTNHIWLAIQDVKRLFENIGLDFLKGFLEELEITESFCDSIRRSLASTENIKSLLVKRQIVSNADQRKFYALATLSCIQLTDPGSAWIWIQKGKARALSDLFGVRAFVPSSLLQTIYDDPAAHKLYQQELKSTENALHASPHAYIGAARKATADREAMKAVPVLAQLLAIREGAFDVSLETSHIQQSLNLSNVESQKLKYVDWYFLPNSEGATETIAIFVRDLSGNTSFRELTVTVSNVHQWIRKVFEPPEGAEPELKRKAGNRTLWELNGLLDGIDKLTNEDDLLILSPCGILNSVPLHGLKVDGRVLIDRNLIIYSSSAAVFRQCQARAAASANTSTHPGEIKETHSRNDFLAVYEETSSLAAEERTNIFTSVNNIAQNFQGNLKLGQEVSKTAFIESCRDASWLFYHGHAIYNKQNVLESGLVLSDHDLTISDIFDSAAMHNSPHVTIIACDSGTQHIAPGDEPLGVVPALLFAGATSVLGCLWPIESWAGRVFSEKFHTHLNTQIVGEKNEEGSRIVVNVAAALRDAVREMMDKKSVETRLPYFWASFVLHGCWFHTKP
jgi:CHAT domain-containing protein